MILRFQQKGGIIEVYRGKLNIGYLHKNYSITKSIPDGWTLSVFLSQYFLGIEKDDIFTDSLENTMSLVQSLENITEREKRTVKFVRNPETPWRYQVMLNKLQVGCIETNGNHNAHNPSRVFDEDLSKFLELPCIEHRRGSGLGPCKRLARIRLFQNPKPDWEKIYEEYKEQRDFNVRRLCFSSLCHILLKEDIPRRLDMCRRHPPDDIPYLALESSSTKDVL